MTIYIIGAGNMGGAIARTLVKAGHKVYIADKNSAKAKGLGGIVDKNFENLNEADAVIIAVKPQDVAALSSQIKIPSSALIISIAAGTKIAKIQKLFGRKVIRMMPNLGLIVGHGIAAWKAAGLLDKDKIRAKKLLNQIMENFEVQSEKIIDAVTAISGSGPAYFFAFADGLRRAAIDLGLKPDQARMLVEKTLLASAVLQKQASYQELIAKVRSKKGTTDAALKVFDKYRTLNIIKSATKAARDRAEELSNG